MKQKSKENILWDRIVDDMRNYEKVGDYAFDAYISKLRLIEDTGTHLRLEYPSDLLIDWVEVNYKQNIINSAVRTLDAARQLEFLSDSCLNEKSSATKTTENAAKPSQSIKSSNAPASPHKKSQRSHTKAARGNGLNPQFTFENFVVGSSNEFAYASALAVASNEECIYNPLFIYGNSGLGKTHLLHAIGNAIREKNDKAKVFYLTSEEFTNAYIDAMSKRGDSLSAFRRKYRSADILLIDDIQFFANKEKTQEEFFHTFNTLFASGKQIILSADCSVADITTMDSRLTSRFEQGMVVGITSPSLETRTAILRHKRKQWNSKHISDEVIDFLAQNISSSVRKLEGALTRISVYASFTERIPSIADVRNYLKDMLSDNKKQQITIEGIMKQVAEKFQLRLSDFTSRRRTANIAHPRQIAMYLARQCTQHSLQDIGRAFGGRDHGTVIHAAKTVASKMNKDKELCELVTSISAQFAS